MEMNDRIAAIIAMALTFAGLSLILLAWMQAERKKIDSDCLMLFRALSISIALPMWIFAAASLYVNARGLVNAILEALWP
jgi:hypothetical protein